MQCNFFTLECVSRFGAATACHFAEQHARSDGELKATKESGHLVQVDAKPSRE